MILAHVVTRSSAVTSTGRNGRPSVDTPRMVPSTFLGSSSVATPTYIYSVPNLWKGVVDTGQSVGFIGETRVSWATSAPPRPPWPKPHFPTGPKIGNRKRYPQIKYAVPYCPPWLTHFPTHHPLPPTLPLHLPDRQSPRPRRSGSRRVWWRRHLHRPRTSLRLPSSRPP